MPHRARRERPAYSVGLRPVDNGRSGASQVADAGPSSPGRDEYRGYPTYCETSDVRPLLAPRYPVAALVNDLDDGPLIAVHGEPDRTDLVRELLAVKPGHIIGWQIKSWTSRPSTMLK